MNIHGPSLQYNKTPAMQQPLISIITITFNASVELAPTMKSIAEQSFSDFEHIIVDGASSDNTLSVARELASPSLRILSEKDNGLYDAMNKGLRMAQGKYLLFLNAGDSFHTPDTLSLYADAARSCPDIIYADTVLVDADRNYVAPRHLSVPEKLTYRSFSKGMLVCHQAFMVRREIAPPYNLEYRFSADYDWTLNCLRKTTPEKTMNLHTVAIDYLTDGLTDKNHKASLKERFTVMRRHFGTATAVLRHISFIPRAIARKFSR